MSHCLHIICPAPNDMLPINSHDSFKFLPAPFQALLKSSLTVFVTDVADGGGLLQRATILDVGPPLNRVRVREIFSQATNQYSVSLEKVDSYLVTLPPGDYSIFSKALATQSSGIKLHLLSETQARPVVAVDFPRDLQPPHLWQRADSAEALKAWIWQALKLHVLVANEQIGFLPSFDKTPLPGVGNQWAWTPEEQSGGGFTDSEVAAVDGAANVRMGILDTGMNGQIPHPALIGKNGSPLPWKARNFLPDQAEDNLLDRHGHGTACVSITSAQPHGGKGFRAICPNASLLVARMTNGLVLERHAVEAVHWAINQGCQIVSMSWIMLNPSIHLRNAISHGRETLFVAAPDNRNHNLQQFPKYPACNRQPNLISVIGSCMDGILAVDSDYDPSELGLAHIAAPSAVICGCNLDGGYSVYNGTSMAVPHVAGLAAMLYAHHLKTNPGKLPTPEAIIELIVTNAFCPPDHAGNFPVFPCSSKGRISVREAMKNARQRWP